MPPGSIEMPVANSGEDCHVVRTIRDGFCDRDRGLIYGAYLVHMPAHWIVVGAVVLLGVGILTGVKATRQKDPVG